MQKEPSSTDGLSAGRVTPDGYASSNASSSASSVENSPTRAALSSPEKPVPPLNLPEVTNVQANGDDIASYFSALSDIASSRNLPAFPDAKIYHPATASPLTPLNNLGISGVIDTPADNPSIENNTAQHDDINEQSDLSTSFNNLNRRARLTTPNGRSYISVICPFDERVHYSPYIDMEAMTSEQLSESDVIFSKEFAELSMICRVLSMALDPIIPLLDRFKFLCIVSMSIDEQFSKRLGHLPKLDLTDMKSATINLRRQVRPKTRYEEEFTVAIRTLVEKQHECLNDELLPALQKKGVRILKADELTPTESANMTSFFKENLRQVMTPILLDPTHPFPLLQSHVIYIYVTLFNPRNALKRIVLFRVPSEKRLIPVDEAGLRFVTCEEVCLSNLDLVCQGMVVLSAQMFRVTRNTKISIEDEALGDMSDLLDFIVEELHRRRQAPVTRLEVMDTAPPQMIKRLVEELKLDDMDVYTVKSPLLDLASCMSLAFTPLPSLRQVIRDPVVPGAFKGLTNRLITDPGAIFGVIRKKDVLVEYPRDNFEHSVVLFLHAAARDPAVRSIKSVLYRGGSDSPIVAALIRAAKNGKEVSVVIELKASFDEVQNSEYSRQLRIAGCNVTYGVMGLKVHSKVMLVVREESGGKLRSYVNVATGNFNPKTAKLYTDYALFTCDKDICTDVLDVFNSLTGYSLNQDFRTLLVAPVNMHRRFIELIREEAENARNGKEARIACQMNGLTDKDITRELYNASKAGVRIDLIVRGSCRLRPGIKGMSENIQVYSWVGQLLQHRRVYHFHANGENKFYIGSADWRTRNLTERVEVVVPVRDQAIRKRLAKAFNLTREEKWIWRMAPDGHYYKGLPSSKSPTVSAAITAKTDADTKETREIEDFGTDEEEKLKAEIVQRPTTGSGSGYNAVIDAMAEGERMMARKSSRRASENGTATDGASNGMNGGKGKNSGKKQKKKFHVNVKGNTRSVDKIAVGAIPIRFADEENKLASMEVLMVARGESDAWAVPKGGRGEFESAQEATVRIAREKAGVSVCEELANLGWIDVAKRHKHVAFETCVLLVMELGTFAGNDRRRRWMPVGDAITYARNHHDHDYAQKALERTRDSVRAKFGDESNTGSAVMSATPVTRSPENSLPSSPPRNGRGEPSSSLPFNESGKS